MTHMLASSWMRRGRALLRPARLVAICGLVVAAGVGVGVLVADEEEPVTLMKPGLCAGCTEAERQATYVAIDRRQGERRAWLIANFDSLGIDPRTLRRDEVMANFRVRTGSLDAVRHAVLIVGVRATGVKFTDEHRGTARITADVLDVIKGEVGPTLEFAQFARLDYADIESDEIVLLETHLAPLVLPGQRAVLLMTWRDASKRDLTPFMAYGWFGVDGIEAIHSRTKAIRERPPSSSRTEWRPRRGWIAGCIIPTIAPGSGGALAAGGRGDAHEATDEGLHGVLDRADGIGGLAHQAECEAIDEGEDRLGDRRGREPRRELAVRPQRGDEILHLLLKDQE